MIKIVYDISSGWEVDYIQELFSIISYDIIFVPTSILQTKIEGEDKIVNNNILVF